MEQKEKNQIIAERVNELFAQILELKASNLMKQYLDFCERVIEHSAFNNTLVFIQKPSCFYYATKSEWKQRFNREIKDFARPLLILFPFAPVEFVYDLEDTNGDPLPKNFIYWWQEERGDVSKNTLDNLMSLCNELHIKTAIAPSEYIKHYDHKAFGVASKYKLSNERNERSIKLHPRYEDPDLLQEALGVLVHEIAHHLLGHLGGFSVFVQTRDKNQEVVIATKNHNNDRVVREAEAELTAWFVFAKLGAKKRSSEYLAHWLTEGGAKEVRIKEVCKTADNIYKMSQGERWWVKKAAMQANKLNYFQRRQQELF